MEDNDEEAIQSFIAITDTSADVARDYLAATFNNLEQAIARYYSQAEEGLSNGGTKTDEELARELSMADSGPMRSGPSGIPQASGSGAEWGGEDNVRAPIPAMMDRLYGDAALHPVRQRPPTQDVNAFRDFGAENSRRRGISGAAPKREGGLGAMYEPPTALMYQGDWDSAQAHAQDHSKWMLVNLQSNKEFASHRLNRDTWANPALQDIIRGSFVFIQYEISSQEGERFQAYYKVYDLPALVVIDPITGSAMRTFHGFLEPDRLSEDLVHYMDHNPEDPAAQRKRKFSQTKPTVASTEEDELAKALAMSMETQAHQPGDMAESDDLNELDFEGEEDDNGENEVSVSADAEGADGEEGLHSREPPAQRDPAAIQAEALASLPQEPSSGDKDSCRVRVRLPNGSAVNRSFLKSDTLEVLRTFCVATLLEAASGKAFNIVQAGIGGPAVVFQDMSKTLGEAGLANSVVSISWA